MKQLAVVAAALVATMLPYPGPAQAQGLATTTFVSGNGFDTNPCTAQNPCRSFQHAHDQTAAGGQITMLDPAGYGTVVITKAISIVNDGGGEAGINDPGPGDAITINAGAGDVVTLRGLTLNGVGTGADGIVFVSGAALNIQNCVIRGFVGAAVFTQPTASAAITISDTIASNNAAGGVVIAPMNGMTSVYLERVAAIGSTGTSSAGFSIQSAGAGANVGGTIVDSVALDNSPTNSGVGFLLGPGSQATIALINSKSIGNALGLAATGAVVISRVTLAGNTTDGYAASGLKTFGDNYIIDTTNTGTLTPISPQ